MDHTLLQSITAVGMTEKEARVFLALLSLGEGTVTEIAEKAELKRSIVYVVLQTLMKDGYAVESEGGTVKYVRAVDPRKLVQNVQSHVENLKVMLPLLRALQQKGRNRPRIEVFEGAAGITSVFHTFKDCREARYLSSYGRLHEFFPREVERWVHRAEETAEKPTRTWQLMVDEPEGRHFAARVRGINNYAVRFLPQSQAIDMDFAIVDDVLAITSFDPLYIVSVQSERIAASAAVLFDLAWKASGVKK